VADGQTDGFAIARTNIALLGNVRQKPFQIQNVRFRSQAFQLRYCEPCLMLQDVRTQDGGSQTGNKYFSACTLDRNTIPNPNPMFSTTGFSMVIL